MRVAIWITFVVLGYLLATAIDPLSPRRQVLVFVIVAAVIALQTISDREKFGGVR